MLEPRRFVRLATRMNVVYTVLHDERPIRSMTGNISGGGLSFFANAPLSPGTRLKVELTLPEQESPIPFTAEVVCSEESLLISPTAQERAVEIGARFVEIAPEDQDAIMRYVESGLYSPRAVASPSR